MPTNKSRLKKEIEADLREVNNTLTILDRQYRTNEITLDTYRYCKSLLHTNRDHLLRIMEICVQRNRF